MTRCRHPGPAHHWQSLCLIDAGNKDCRPVFRRGTHDLKEIICPLCPRRYTHPSTRLALHHTTFQWGSLGHFAHLTLVLSHTKGTTSSADIVLYGFTGASNLLISHLLSVLSRNVLPPRHPPMLHWATSLGLCRCLNAVPALVDPETGAGLESRRGGRICV